jgi:hypothetical protein
MGSRTSTASHLYLKNSARVASFRCKIVSHMAAVAKSTQIQATRNMMQQEVQKAYPSSSVNVTALLFHGLHSYCKPAKQLHGMHPMDTDDENACTTIHAEPTCCACAPLWLWNTCSSDSSATFSPRQAVLFTYIRPGRSTPPSLPNTSICVCTPHELIAL